MSASLPSLAVYVGAAYAEIAGCFAFWVWLRLDRSPLWVLPGLASLALFAFLLTRVDLAFAGRAYAADGGIYIAASLAWLWAVGGQSPDRWDLAGAGVCILGAAIILLGLTLGLDADGDAGRAPYQGASPMIDFMQESTGNILGVRAGGKLTEDDYKNRLVPRLESLIERLGKVRVLFYMDETFQGWDLKSAWANTTLDVRHRADLEKIAVVGAPAWEEWCVKLAGLLMTGEIRTFQPDQLQQAWGWLRA